MLHVTHKQGQNLTWDAARKRGMMRIAHRCSHLFSFTPAHSGGRLSGDLDVKAEFVPSNHCDDVLVTGAAGIQVDFRRVCHVTREKEREKREFL